MAAPMLPTPIMPTSSLWATGAIGEKPIFERNLPPARATSGDDLAGRSDNRAAPRRDWRAAGSRSRGVQA